jgi:Lon-like ATP-dependent protease
MTGELSIRGHVRPIGGVVAKVEAAQQAGCQRVLVPTENWQEVFRTIAIEVVPVDTLNQVIEESLVTADRPEMPGRTLLEAEFLTASPSSSPGQ